MKNIKTFRKVRASIINEKLKAKKPSDKITIDVDLDYNPDSDEQQDRDSEKIFKKFKLDVTPNGATDVSFDMSGKKQDLINYLQSKYYSFDDEDIRDLYPELLEAINEASSAFKHAVQQAIKAAGYNLKQSEVKVGAKKVRGMGTKITLNGEMIGFDDNIPEMITSFTKSIEEDPEKYGLK
jgi:restriction endonuclease Mrr